MSSLADRGKLTITQNIANQNTTDSDEAVDLSSRIERYANADNIPDARAYSAFISTASKEGEIIKTVPVNATPIQTKRKGDTFSLIKYPEKSATNKGEVHCKTTAVVSGIKGIA